MKSKPNSAALVAMVLLVSCQTICCAQVEETVDQAIDRIANISNSNDDEQKEFERVAAEAFSWRLRAKPRGYEATPEFQALTSIYWSAVLQNATPTEEMKVDGESLQELRRILLSNSKEIEVAIPQMRQATPHLQDKSDAEILGAIGFATMKAQNLDADWKKRGKITIGFMGCWYTTNPRDASSADLQELSELVKSLSRSQRSNDKDLPTVIPSKGEIEKDTDVFQIYSELKRAGNLKIPAPM